MSFEEIGDTGTFLRHCRDLCLTICVPTRPRGYPFSDYSSRILEACWAPRSSERVALSEFQLARER